MKKIAVILAGCGNKDGSEIYEAVSLTIALGMAEAQIEFFAPNNDFTALNFMTDQALPEKRNVLVESARIARSKIKNISELQTKSFDGLAFPGGYGVALNLCDWASKGSECTIHPEVKRCIDEFYQQSKPIAAICIAPVLIAKVLGKKGITVTTGNDLDTANEIIKTGAYHVDCPVDDYVTDRENKIITTPAYMYGDAKPYQVFKGISALVKEFIEMA